MAEGFITRKSGGSANKNGIPEYKYTGNSFTMPIGKDGTGDNALWLTSNGTISFPKDVYADIYLVGGGGGGGDTYGGGGGGSGYTYVKNNIFIPANCNFAINIGQGGGRSINAKSQGGYGAPTTAFGFFANGGYGGGGTGSSDPIVQQSKGGDGGSGGGAGTVTKSYLAGKGGAGGSNGYGHSTIAGAATQSLTGGLGQGDNATYLFNDANNLMLAYGGAGGAGGSTIPDITTNLINDYYPHDLTNIAFGSGGKGTGKITNSFGTTVYGADNGQNGVVVIKFKNRQNFPTIIPKFNYYNQADNTPAPYVITANASGDWQTKFLSNGIFSPSEDMNIDAFLVGGGGGGGARAGGGGAGGYTKTGLCLSLTAREKYPITIGSGGITSINTAAAAFNTAAVDSYGTFGQMTTAFNLCAPGGSGGIPYSSALGGIGGSGGGMGVQASKANAQSGAFDGQNATTSFVISSRGQGYTTRAFKENGEELYAGGGGGGSAFTSKISNTVQYGTFGKDGLGGGGRGGFAPYAGMHGIDSFGGGGGGGGSSTTLPAALPGGNGGSGTVIIRPSKLNPTFTIESDKNLNYYYENDNTIVCLSNGSFSIDGEQEQLVDIFLVGGGGGGGSSTSTAAMGGGGGGFTQTYRSIMLKPNINYTINIGEGGDVNVAGQPTSLTASINTDDGQAIEQWQLFAGGGMPPSGASGGSGGSGGGMATTKTTQYPGFGGFNGQSGYNVQTISTPSTTFTFGTGLGQGTSTSAFEEGGELYAGGGAGGSAQSRLAIGGIGGGGSTTMPDGIPNTGGGGSGGILDGNGGKGGSGIVFLRKKEVILSADAEQFIIGQIQNVTETLEGNDITYSVLETDNQSWTYSEQGYLKIIKDCYLCYLPSKNTDIATIEEDQETNQMMEIDLYLVGGGGAGGAGTSDNICGAGGGGGETKNIYKVPIYKNRIYKATIGEGGPISTTDNGTTTIQNDGQSTKIEYYGYLTSDGKIEAGTIPIDAPIDIVNFSVKGGTAANGINPGAGGSGGASGSATSIDIGNVGGSNGSNGLAAFKGGAGQRTSTKPFNEKAGLAYGSGGGSAGALIPGFAGKEGGGQGGTSIVINGQNGMINRGGGGGGSYYDGNASGTVGKGGSGAIIIRKTVNDFNRTFTYTVSEEDPTPAQWEYDQYGIRFLESGVFTLLPNHDEDELGVTVDLFLVSGGGGGSHYGTDSAGGGAGGGGGYVLNTLSQNPDGVQIFPGSDYKCKINIGAGGAGATFSSGAKAGATGGVTSIEFKQIIQNTEDNTTTVQTVALSASGGEGGSTTGDGGAGGSGGGAGAGKGGTGTIGGINGGSAIDVSSSYEGGIGAGISTIAFEDPNTVEIFANGGSGAGVSTAGYGAGRGGNKSNESMYDGQDALPNTGSGGGGAAAIAKKRIGGNGGSGVLIMRMH